MTAAAVALVYLVMSAIAYGTYALDKSAARAGVAGPAIPSHRAAGERNLWAGVRLIYDSTLVPD